MSAVEWEGHINVKFFFSIFFFTMQTRKKGKTEGNSLCERQKKNINRTSLVKRKAQKKENFFFLSIQ